MQIKYFHEQAYTLIIIYHLGALENSIHIICDHKTKKSCVIDPAWDSDLLVHTSQDAGYDISAIWLTHWHFDHTNASDDLALKTGAPIYAGAYEIPYLSAIKQPIHSLSDGQIIQVGDVSVRVIHTPGHSAGGISFLLKNNFIAGDVLFVYGAGHCQLAGADARQLFLTMQKIKTQIPDNTYLRCGHDYGDVLTTTMAVQKKSNPFLLIDNMDDFVRYREKIHDKTRKYPMSALSLSEIKALL